MSKLRGFNPFESDINCTDPQIIINPKLPELLATYGNYVLLGEFHRVNISNFLVHTFPLYKFNPNRPIVVQNDKNGQQVTRISLKDVENCYIVDMSTGEVAAPMYFVVPCGRCIICTSSKCSNFARRCQYETQLYDCDPVHITMTYDDEHLPEDKSVSVRAMQLWKKRVRINLNRAGYDKKIRLCIAAEYGKRNTRRPHYHAIIWNLQNDKIFTDTLFKDILYNSWQNCHYKRFTFSRINNDYIPKDCKRSLADMGKTSYQAFGYVAKYFYKQDASSVPPGCKPLFHLMSKSKSLGGIGAPFIDKHKNNLRFWLRQHYYYTEKSGSLEEITYDRYVINRVFPSKYMSVGSKVRKQLQFLCRYSCQCPEFESRCNNVFNFYKRLFPVLSVSGADKNFCFRVRRSCSLVGFTHRLRIINALNILETEIEKTDIDMILYIDERRHKLLNALFRNKQKINVNDVKIKLMQRKYRRLNEFTKL